MNISEQFMAHRISDSYRLTWHQKQVALARLAIGEGVDNQTLCALCDEAVMDTAQNTTWQKTDKLRAETRQKINRLKTETSRVLADALIEKVPSWNNRIVEHFAQVDTFFLNCRFPTNLMSDFHVLKTLAERDEMTLCSIIDAKGNILNYPAFYEFPYINLVPYMNEPRLQDTDVFQYISIKADVQSVIAAAKRICKQKV